MGENSIWIIDKKKHFPWQGPEQIWVQLCWIEKGDFPFKLDLEKKILHKKLWVIARKKGIWQGKQII